MVFFLPTSIFFATSSTFSSCWLLLLYFDRTNVHHQLTGILQQLYHHRQKSQKTKRVKRVREIDCMFFKSVFCSKLNRTYICQLQYLVKIYIYIQRNSQRKKIVRTLELLINALCQMMFYHTYLQSVQHHYSMQ